MSENDVIAEYVKTQYPEMLTTMDFAVFRIRKACQKFAEDFLESFKRINMLELLETVEKVNERTKQEDKQ